MLRFSSPSTPTRSTDHFSCSSLAYTPAHSSPLASSSPPPEPKSSPVSEAQARRQLQYKARLPPSTPSISRSRARPSKTQQRRVSLAGPSFKSVEDAPVSTEEAPRTAFLRERFKARCIERAQKDRERKIKGKRFLHDLSSDVPDEDMDQDDDDDDEIINDELFQRIIVSTKRKQQHSYRVSYSQDVGSSFDPALEDIDQWEKDLDVMQPGVEIPEDLDAEVEAYAAEYELHLDELDLSEIFNTSDDEDSGDGKSPRRGAPAHIDEDVDMTL